MIYFLETEDTPLGTNFSPTKALLKLMFFFPRWDMLVSLEDKDTSEKNIFLPRPNKLWSKLMCSMLRPGFQLVFFEVLYILKTASLALKEGH